jgi:hypothetical protein
MTKAAFDFSPSASDRRRQDRARRSLERERKRKRAAALKRSKKEVLRRKRELRRIEAKRKKDEQRQRKADERQLRADRKRWNKPPRQRRRGDDLQTAIRLFGLFGSVLNRVDKNKQAELIAYADEHMAEIYEAPVQDAPAEKQTGPGFIGRALQGLRNLIGA